MSKGDRGSAYSISENALRLALRQHERHGLQTNESEEIFSNLLSAFMQQLEIHSLKELVVWSLSAKKHEIAELAPLVLDLWKQKDDIAGMVINASVDDLSDDLICLVGKFRTVERIAIGLTGSLFSKDSDFTDAFKRRLHSKLVEKSVTIKSVKILRNTTLGSLKMLDPLKWKIVPDFIPNSNSLFDERAEIRCKKESQLAQNILPIALGLSLTEKRNEKSMNLDRMDVEDAIELMIAEEQSIFGKIRENKASIRILVERVCKAFQSGGRLFYVGAGTSGRLGKKLFNFFIYSTSKLIPNQLIDQEFWMQVNVHRHLDLHRNGFKVSSLVVSQLLALQKKVQKIQYWTAWKPLTIKRSIARTWSLVSFPN